MQSRVCFTSEQAAPQSFPLPLSGPVCEVWCTTSVSARSLSHFSSLPLSQYQTHTLPVYQQHMQHKHSDCVIRTEMLKHVNCTSTFPCTCTHTHINSPYADAGQPCNVTGWSVASSVAWGWESDGKNKSGSRAKKGWSQINREKMHKGCKKK